MMATLVDTLFTGNGRIGRLAFMLGVGGLALLDLVAGALPDEGPGGLLALALRLILLFSLGCLLSQRLHDIGRAGWWLWPILAALVLAGRLGGPPALAGVAAVVAAGLGLWPGQTTFNRYGAPPSGLVATGPKIS
jgi:uncharacterized membrane protein YhaH (DUF805 family)